MRPIETGSPLKGCHVKMRRRPDFCRSVACSLAEQNIYLYSYTKLCPAMEIGSTSVVTQHPVIVKSVLMIGS